MVIRLRIEISNDDRQAIALAHGMQNKKAGYQKCKSLFLGAVDGELEYCYDMVADVEERERDREE